MGEQVAATWRARTSAADSGRLVVHVAVPVDAATLAQVRATLPDARVTYMPNTPYVPPHGQAPYLADAEVVLGYHAGFDLALAPRLRWYHLASDGVDHLRGTPIMGSPDVLLTNTRVFGAPIAEYVFASVLAFYRDFPRMYRRFQLERVYPRDQWTEYCGEELHGKTLVILGFGDIGRALARRARAFEMKVVGVRRSIRAPEVEDGAAIYPPDALHEVLAMADVLVVCLPLTNETEGCIGEAELRCLRPTAYLVAVGRGRVIQEAALGRALREGWIAGAGLDVYSQKPLPPDSPLFDLPNVVMTPHMSGITRAFQGRLATLFCENLRRYVGGSPLLNVVDKRKGY